MLAVRTSVGKLVKKMGEAYIHRDVADDCRMIRKSDIGCFMVCAIYWTPVRACTVSIDNECALDIDLD